MLDMFNSWFYDREKFWNFMLHERIRENFSSYRPIDFRFAVASNCQLVYPNRLHNIVSSLVYEHQMNNAMTWCGGKFLSYLSRLSLSIQFNVNESRVQVRENVDKKILITRQLSRVFLAFFCEHWTNSAVKPPGNVLLTPAPPRSARTNIDNFFELSDFCNWKFQHV